MTDKNALDVMSDELEVEMAADRLRAAAGTVKEKDDSVENRPVHRLEGILTMQQHTLEQAIAHRKEFETAKEENIAEMEAAFRRHIDTCDKKISQVSEALGLLQKEKMDLYASMEKRRQEIIEQFKADEAALVKIIKAQRGVISALREEEEGDGGQRRPNGSVKPNNGNDRKQETGQTGQRPN
jgi:hypothetical protein